MITTVDGLVAALGGADALAGTLMAGDGSHVEMWIDAGRVPNAWHLRVLILCSERGLDVAPHLFDLAAPDLAALAKWAHTGYLQKSDVRLFKQSDVPCPFSI